MSDTHERFTCFWGSESPFSQWHPSRFEVNGEHFSCAEQYMMYGKARLFGDMEVAARILEASGPRRHKALGRQVRGFQQELWERARERIVYEGNHAKFTQNPPLLAALEATVGTRLVEASPTDRIWGVGLTEDDPRILTPSTWCGLNLLGQVLTRLREDLLAARTGTHTR